MKYSIKHIGELLKKARLSKSFSQRDLSAKAHVPQSHISRIENGSVDLHVSSLIEISRTLGLELMLVPQKLVPVVKALQKSTNQGSQEQRPLYSLDEEEDD